MSVTSCCLSGGQNGGQDLFFRLNKQKVKVSGEQIFASISPPPYAIPTYRAACRLFNHSTIEPIDKQTVVGNGEQILTIS